MFGSARSTITVLGCALSACAPPPAPAAREPAPAVVSTPSAASSAPVAAAASSSPAPSSLDALSLGPPKLPSPKLLFAKALGSAGVHAVRAKTGGVAVVDASGELRRFSATGDVTERRALVTGNLFHSGVSSSANGDVVATGGFQRLLVDGKPVAPTKKFDAGPHGAIRGAFVVRRDGSGKLAFVHSLPSVPRGVLALGPSTAVWGHFDDDTSIAGVTVERGFYVAVLAADGAVAWTRHMAKPAEWAASLDGEQLLRALPDEKGSLLVDVWTRTGTEQAHTTVPTQQRVDLLAVSADRMSLSLPLREHGRLDLGLGAVPEGPGFALLGRSLTPTASSWLRAVHLPSGSAATISLRALAPTPTGGLLLTGVVGGTASGNTPLPGGGSSDLLVIEVDAEGRQQWAARWPLPDDCSMSPMTDNTRPQAAIIGDHEVYVALSCPRIEQAPNTVVGADKGWLVAWERPR